MEKLKMMSMDKTQMNIQKIKEQFPNAVTEVLRNGKPALAVDFDVLKQELSDALIDEREERYQFTWPDKRKSVLLANSPISATLRPVKEDETTPSGADASGKPYISSGSVNFDTTQNLYIEGDNLDVLKLLQETYLGKIDVIYIDPPYNTGNSLIYLNDYSQTVEEFASISGEYDTYGNKLVLNTEANGRFHTDWLNMIYPRLKVAKDLLKDTGILVLTIDDYEINNVTTILNEIFGESNHMGTVVIKNNPSGRSTVKGFSVNHEYALFYSKTDSATLGRMEHNEAQKARYKEKDEIGCFEWENFRKNGTDSDRSDRPKQFFPIIVNEKTNHLRVPNVVWIESQKEYSFNDQILDNEAILFPTTQGGIEKVWKYGLERTKQIVDKLLVKKTSQGYEIYRKKYLNDEGSLPRTWWDKPEYSARDNGTRTLTNILGPIKLFDFPKAPEAVKDALIAANLSKDGIVLDFFSGSATTAHAVMQLNAEDGGTRKFIMVQLPEKCNEKSEAYKAGYKNICEIGKERIRRAGKKIQENIKFYKPLEDYITEEERESGKATIAKTASNGTSGLIDEIESGTETFIDLVTKEKTTKEYSKNNPKDHYRFYPDDLDIGFRVLKLDSSNMKDVYYRPEQYRQSLLENLGDNIKEDRTPLDLLFQVMLELGKPLSAKIEEKDICGKHVFIVDENDLIACFDADVTAETVKAIALLKPLYAVFRDSSLADDAVGSNFDQIFATYSPNTTRRVL